eukprot:12862325-Alexandrium_andersonii.AAC.1
MISPGKAQRCSPGHRRLLAPARSWASTTAPSRRLQVFLRDYPERRVSMAQQGFLHGRSMNFNLSLIHI